MLEIYSEELPEHLTKKNFSAYLLLGSDPLLLQESENAVRQMAIKHGFNECNTIQINSNTDWQSIFLLCQSRSLFSSKQIIMLILPDDDLNPTTNKQLVKLIEFLHNDLLLIIRGNRLTKSYKKADWLTNLKKKRDTIIVVCQTPNHTQLPKWIIKRASQYNLQIDDASCQLLCYCYENNLLALVQVLNQLLLLYPDGKISFSRLKLMINDTARFKTLHWIEALLAANNKRAMHIIHQLRLGGSEPIVLLRTLQRETLLLISLKRQVMHTPMHILLNKYQVWQNRRSLIIKAINRLSHNQLSKVIYFLTQTEFDLKQNYYCCQSSIWLKLRIVSMLFCHKGAENIFFTNYY